MCKSTRNALLRDTNIELYTENQELKREVKYLQEELDNANEILDSIENVLMESVDAETAHFLYNKIFQIEE